MRHDTIQLLTSNLKERSPAILVTGVSGDLGTRLVPLLRAAEHEVLGVDWKAPQSIADLTLFHSLDLGREQSCDELIELMRDNHVGPVVHLAFVLDPRKAGVLDTRRMWQINVAGTARVMEAITEVNRRDGNVRQFIHMSSVAAYGAKLPPLADEATPLNGRGLVYAEHKREADIAVQRLSHSLGKGCSTVILRPQIFSGPTVHNYMIDALRGAPSQAGRLGRWMIRHNRRAPILADKLTNWRERRIQFVHVDDVARTIAWFLSHPGAEGGLETFNITGRGEPLTLEQCGALTGVSVVALPGSHAVSAMLKLAWGLGASNVPPDALPYVLGEYTLSTERLRRRTGAEYDRIVQFTNADALESAM